MIILRPLPTETSWRSLTPEQRRELPEPVKQDMFKQMLAEARADAPVYFFYAHQTGKIKIGYSMQPGLRRLGLQKIHGPLTLLAVEPGGRQREKELHELFHEEREEGEWFVASQRLITYMGSLQMWQSMLDRIDGFRK